MSSTPSALDFYAAPQRRLAMTQTTHPPKQLVRDWMAQRVKDKAPPPDQEEIRRQLGWSIIEAERAAKRDNEQH